MKTAALAAIKFFAGFFQEDRPESFSRGITVVVVAFVLGWDTNFVHHSHSLPDALTLTAQAAFMTVFYFGGKGIGAVVDVKKAQAEGDKQ